LETFDDGTEILFEMPVTFDLEKSEGGKRGVKGYGSTEVEDKDEETAIMKGMDYRPLKEDGFINYDHQRAIIAGAKVPIIIGYPTDVVMKSEGLWIEGELLNGDPMASQQNRLANEMWELGINLQKSGGIRRLAYSIEGQVTERRGKKLVKTVARAAALTHKPVNATCSVELFQKSFCCGKCSPEHPQYNPAHKCSSGNKQFLFADGLPHLMAALEKSLSTENSGPVSVPRPSPLIAENLDRGITSGLYGEEPCDKHYDPTTGRFYNGIAGAVEHMTDCLGYSNNESFRLLRRLLSGAEKSADLTALIKTAGLIKE